MPKIPLFPKQKEFFFDTSPEVLFEAGIGYGKSMVASLKLAANTQYFPRSHWFMAASNHKQVRVIDREFEHYLHDLLGLERNVDYTKTNGSPIEYEFASNGSRIYGVGSLNYDITFRSGSYNGGWADEADYWKEEAIQAFRGRIRLAPKRIIWTTSPKGFTAIYKDFHVNKIGPIYHATTYENPTLAEGYIETLKKTYGGEDSPLFKQEVLGVRLNLNQGACYKGFDADRHVKEFELPGGSWFCGQDFNVDPGTLVAAKYVNGMLYIWDELFMRNSDTYIVGKEAVKRGYTGVLYPDSTGRNRSTTGKTNHQIMKDYGFNVRYVHNPHVIDRVNNLNRLFSLDKIIIHPRCKKLIEDLQRVCWMEGRNDIDKRSDPLLTHISDCLGYLAWGAEPMRGSAGKISMSKR